MTCHAPGRQEWREWATRVRHSGFFVLLALVGACAPSETPTPKAALDEGNLTKKRCENDPEARARFPERCQELAQSPRAAEAKPGAEATDPPQDAAGSKLTAKPKSPIPDLHPVACPSAKDRLTRTISAKVPLDQGSLKITELGDLNRDGLPEYLGVFEGFITVSWVVSRTEKTCYVEVASMLPGFPEKAVTRTNGWIDLDLGSIMNRGRSTCSIVLRAQSDGSSYTTLTVNSAEPAFENGDITAEQCHAQASKVAQGARPKPQPPDKPGTADSAPETAPATAAKPEAEPRVSEVDLAKRRIPRLLAKCDKLKPKLAGILAQVRAAARKGDSDELARLQEKAQAASEEMQDVTADLNADINTAADGDSKKWARMAAEVKRRCVP